MILKRAIAGVTAVIVATGTTFVVAGAADASALTTSFAEEVQYASEEADEAFIAADWVRVRSMLDMFDDSLGRLQGDMVRAQSALTAAFAAQEEAGVALEDAEAALAAVQPLLDALVAAEAAATTASANVATETAAYAAAVAARDAVPAWIRHCLPGAVVPGEPSLEDCFDMLNPAWLTLDSMATSAFARLQSARFLLTSANITLDAAQQAWVNAGGEAKVAAVEAARVAVAEADDAEWRALSEIDFVQGVLDDLAPYIASAEDRRADLADLETVERTVVWTVGADSETPRAGDAVKLTFTLTNTELFAISGAAVRVVSPEGIAASCDIAEGVVAAGAVVTCTALYETTAADAVAGAVAFEVELTGYLPLGPGNPRGNAITRTLFTVTESIVVPVAAGAEAEPGAGAGSGDAEALAETGLDSTGLGAMAAAMILAGAALLIVRRRFAAHAV